jgi:hypothetical protein
MLAPTSIASLIIKKPVCPECRIELIEGRVRSKCA